VRLAKERRWSAVLIAAFDSTVAVTTGITALATVLAAALGYLGGRESKKVARVQAEAQLNQLREERTLADREARGQLYREFLDVERGLDTLLSAGEPITAERFYGWVDEYQKRFNAVLLFGVQDVSSSLEQFGPLRRELYFGLHHADPNFEERLREVAAQSDKERRERRHALVDEMRRDVAPDSKPVLWPSGV
jgi:hypothetical protein